MAEKDRRYYDLETHILATTPRCASHSIKELHKDLPLHTAEWVHKNRGDRECVGVIRNPNDRLRSAWKLLSTRYGDLSYYFMLEKLRDNDHVMQQTELHKGTVDRWVLFEDVTPLLPIHLKKSEEWKVAPPIPYDVLEFYADDWEVYNEFQARTGFSVGLDLGVGTTGTSLGRDESEGEHRGSGDDRRSDGLALGREVPGSSGEAEGPGSEGAGLGDSGRSDLGRKRRVLDWGTDYLE